MNPADWMIWLLVAVVTIVDVIFVLLHTPTISRRLRAIGYRLAATPLVWGALGGHFWGPRVDPLFGSYVYSIPVLLAACVLISLFHKATRELFDPPDWFVLFYIPLGIPLGAVCWPQ